MATQIDRQDLPVARPTLANDVVALRRRCPLCGGSVGEEIMPMPFAMFDGSAISGDLDLVACQACGFVFFDTPSRVEDFHRYYFDNLYYDNYRVDLLADDAQIPDRHRATAELLDRYLEDRSTLVVDVGCNDGALLMAPRNCGFANTLGLDMLQATVDGLRARGFRAQIGSAEHLRESVGPVGAYAYSHVVEHLLDPRRALLEARENLVDGGLLYIEVPDADAYPLQDLASWYIYAMYEHVNHFDPAHLEALAGACGFEVVELGNKTIPHRGINPNQPVSCLFALFRKTAAGASEALSSDGSLARKLRQRVERLSFDPGRVLEQLAADRVPVYVWGISQFVQMMLACSPLRECHIAALLDRDAYKQSQTIGGRPIQDPSLLATVPGGSVVVLPDAHLAPRMKRHLAGLGFSGRVLILGHGGHAQATDE